MSEIPAEAVQAAAKAIKDESFMAAYSVLARAAVEAATPLIDAQSRADERRKMAAHIREIAADSDWGHVNLRKFIQRHDRLHTGDSVVAVMLALADEIAEPGRETYPKGDDRA